MNNRKEIINELIHSNWNEIANRGHGASDYADGFLEGATWADNNPISPWRKVEDGLPEYTQYSHERYILKVEYGSMIKDCQVTVGWMSSKFKFNVEMDWVKVTHWMKIPEII